MVRRTYPGVHNGEVMKADEEQGRPHGVTHVADLCRAACLLHVRQHGRDIIAGDFTPAEATKSLIYEPILQTFYSHHYFQGP